MLILICISTPSFKPSKPHFFPQKGWFQMQTCCLIGTHWEHSHPHKNGPQGLKSSCIIPEGSGFPCSQPENAHKPRRAKADFCMHVYWWYWWILHLEPSPSSHLHAVMVMADTFGHPFTIYPDYLSSLPAKKGKMDLGSLGAGNICTFIIFNPNPHLCFYVLLNREPSEDEVLQTGVRLLHEIFRKLFASTG